MTNQELIRQLQTATSLLANVVQELDQRQIKTFTGAEGRLAKAPSAKNDPLEFYVNHCTFKKDNEISATDLFCSYKDWCFNNGSLTRGRRTFLDVIAQLGVADGITGVIRGKSYTFKHLALRTK
jgi:hypothetical protein